VGLPVGLSSPAPGLFCTAPDRLNTDALGGIGVRKLGDCMLILAVGGSVFGMRILIDGKSLLSVSGKMPRA